MDTKRNAIFAAVILAVTLATFSIPQAFADYSFATQKALTSDHGTFSSQISDSGGKVYVAYLDSPTLSKNPYFTISSDRTSFSTPMDLDSGSAAHQIQITALGSNVYVSWQNSTSSNSSDILFEKSNDGGTTFNGASPGPPVNISNNPVMAGNPQIAVTGSHVYLVWEDNSGILFRASSDNGTTFNPMVKLGPNGGSGFAPSIYASGSNVYVAWSNKVSSSISQILFEKSSDYGATFNLGTAGSPGTPLNLSNNTSGSTSPHVTGSGSNVYAIWNEFTLGHDHPFFAKSSDGGSSFGIAVDLFNSTTSTSPIFPQIAASGTNVYVVWEEHLLSGSQIYFEKSADSGATFNGGTSSLPGAPVNVSSDAGNAAIPVISAESNNVYITWRDDTLGQEDIDSRTSTDAGTTFGTTSVLTNNLDSSSTNKQATSPAESSESGKIDVVWLDDTTGSSTFDVYYRTGSSSSINIIFDAAQYKLGSNGTISITDPSGSTSINPVTIKSTSDNTGITETFSETGVGTKIFSGQVTFTSASSSSITKKLHVSVGDIITVSFGGQNGNAGIFPRKVLFDLAAYLTTSSPVITVIDQNSNFNPTVAETIPVTISTSKGSQVVNFTETGPDTGIFVNPPGVTIQVANTDTITVTYLGAIGTASVVPGPGPGGAGGGPSGQGLVLDVILSSIVVGGSPSPTPPVFTTSISNIPILSLPPSVKLALLNPNPSKVLLPLTGDHDAPFIINGNGFYLPLQADTLQTTTLATGQQTTMSLAIATNSEVTHLSLFTDLYGAKRNIGDSDTGIVYEKGQPLQLIDPHKFFSSVSVKFNLNGTKNQFLYNITFAKPMPTSDIIFRAWNVLASPNDLDLLEAWEVVQSSYNVTATQNMPSISSNQAVQNTTRSAPSVSNNISNSTASSGDLMDAIKEWSGYSPKSISDVQLLQKMNLTGQHIPTWLMKTSKWVVDGTISVQEFMDALRFLHDNNMIK
jgi:hypothetical protein